MQEEVLIDKYFIVDLYIPSLKMCIEVQGPHHFTINQKSDAKSVVKHRILTKLGYNVRQINAMQLLYRLNTHGRAGLQRATSMLNNMLGILDG